MQVASVVGGVAFVCRMPQPCTVQDFGWHPDLADHRDFLLHHGVVAALLGKLKPRTRKAVKLPESVTWREFCGPVEDQQGLSTSTAHACLALIQQLERRSSGRLLRLSRIFAHVPRDGCSDRTEIRKYLCAPC